MSAPAPRIVEAAAERDFGAAERLFRAYAESLDFDLEFQDFQREIADLASAYAAPKGAILLAFDANEAIGCVGLREFEPGVGEVKRLYVVRRARGSGAGRALARALIEKARVIGYRSLRLDTAPAMLEARGLYRSLGFREIPPYRPNPVAGTTYMELELRPEVHELRVVHRLGPEQERDLMDLYRQAWWSLERSPEDVHRMLGRVGGLVGLCETDGGRLVAFARFLTDGVFKALIYDVIVREELRGTGLGRRLMEELLRHPALASVQSVELHCLPEKVEFYRRFDFTDAVQGALLMRRVRPPADPPAASGASWRTPASQNAG